MSRKGFIGIIKAAQREGARAARQAEQERRRRAREAERAARQLERGLQSAAKEAALREHEERAAEAEERTAELADRVDELQGVLAERLDNVLCFELRSLRVSVRARQFKPPDTLREPVPEPRLGEFMGRVKPLNLFVRLLPAARRRHEEARERARKDHALAIRRAAESEDARRSRLAAMEEEHRRTVQAMAAEALRRNAEIDELEQAYQDGDPDAVAAYYSLLLERSPYPEGFPNSVRVAYAPESRQVVVEFELPTPEIIPAVAAYRYVKTRKVIEEQPRKPIELKRLYQDLVAATTLRTLLELFQADAVGRVDVAVFNGMVSTVDPGTGRDTRPCLISVRAAKSEFLQLDLGRVDLRACLRNLGAQVSAQPADLIAVKPVLELSVVDKRFVDERDMLSDLNAVPNIYEMTPLDFEALVSNLFNRMGLECRLTRASRDGGVDAVVFDTRPVLGGKIVVQAKRYRNTVEVGAVRDLYGTVQHEGATKGILVTTSGFGPDAFSFANDKPIELIDGGGLLYMLGEVGIRARISFPVEG